MVAKNDGPICETHDQGYGRRVPPIFTTGSKPKKGIKKAKKGYIPLDQGYRRGVPPIFTTGSKPKKVYLLDQGYGRGVPPIFTTGSKPKKGIPLWIKATVGGYLQFSLPGQSQKRV